MTGMVLTLKEAGERLRDGSLTSVELTRAVLDRANELDAAIGSYLARFDDDALEAAGKADEELAGGNDRGPLHGIPVAVKDLLAAREGPTTAQSLVLDPGWADGKDAPVVRRLRRAGSVITGKSTTMEFALGFPDPDKPFPIPRNPWDVGRWPGGSSSGAASGIAAGFFLGGVGTDTGGSIRLPAAHCGVTGFKPTFGRVPKSGCTPMGYNQDAVGPLARSAWDCAAMLAAMAGFHPSDPDSADVPVPDFLAGMDGSLAGLRIGVARDRHFPASADPALAECFDRAVATLEEQGATSREVTLPYWDELYFASYLTWEAEAAAYHRQDLRERWDDYFRAARPLLCRGLLAPAADYVQAQRVRRVAQRAVKEIFDEVDLIVSPTAATVAFEFDANDGLLEVDLLLDTLFTWYWNATGNPALAVPMGSGEAGLPLSLQIVGRPFEDGLVLRAGDAYQGVTGWHEKTPPPIRDSSPARRGGSESAGSGANGPPGAAAPEGAEAIVGMLLDEYGIPATDQDVGLLAAGHAGARAGLDAMYAVTETRYELPALGFRPDPVFGDWGSDSAG
jgi:aspartyl-tRNA(Asn)/glutamyl-tRNA(Gln) amidotransferase subunit A